MPRFSVFTRYGHLRYSSEASTPEKIYRALVASYTDPETGLPVWDLSQGTHLEATIYARAMAIAAAKSALERAGNQENPRKVYDLLRSLMRRFGVKLPSSATMKERRDALEQRMASMRGARREYIVSELSRILGVDFVAYRPISTSESTKWPSNPGSGPGVWSRSAIAPKRVRLLDAIATTPPATQEVAYENWNTTQQEVLLAPNDVLCVQPENDGLAEKVTVVSVSGTGASRKLVAAFTKPHDAGASATTGRTPIWRSTKRVSLIVVSAAASIDRAKRSRVNELMRRAARAGAAWYIVREASPGVVGPFQLSVSPIGTVPLGTITI